MIGERPALGADLLAHCVVERRMTGSVDTVSAVLQVDRLPKVYGAVVVLDGIDLVVEPDQLLAVLEPSRCGKSTLLRLVAGLEPPDAGQVTVGGQS